MKRCLNFLFKFYGDDISKVYFIKLWKSVVILSENWYMFFPLCDRCVSICLYFFTSGTENIVSATLDRLVVLFGSEILKIVPGRVSTEVDARFVNHPITLGFPINFIWFYSLMLICRMLKWIHYLPFIIQVALSIALCLFVKVTIDPCVK